MGIELGFILIIILPRLQWIWLLEFLFCISYLKSVDWLSYMPGNEGAVLASHNHLAIHGNANTGCYIKVPEGFVSALLQNSCQILIIIQFQWRVLKWQSACELEPQHGTARGRKQLNWGGEISDTLSQRCTDLLSMLTPAFSQDHNLLCPLMKTVL